MAGIVVFAIGRVVRRAPLALALLGTLAAAASYGPNTVIQPFSLDDQHGHSARVDERVRLLVVSRDMQGGNVVKAALSDADQAFLEARDAVYVADVSRMPAMITRLFALPRMRQRPYRILLDRDGSVTHDVPCDAGEATVIRLDRLRVTEIVPARSAEALRQAIAAGPAPPP